MSDLFRAYMLNEQTESKRDEIRERLLTDAQFFDEMREQENEWIDACAAGRLPAAEAAALRRHLAETGQLGRLPMAAALATPPARRAARSVFPAALGMAAALFVGFGVFFSSQGQRGVTAPVREAPVAMFPLAPGTLRDGRAVTTIPLRAGYVSEVQMLYQDTAPQGTCKTLLTNAKDVALATTVEPCGLDFHSIRLPVDLMAGRHYLQLENEKGEILHTYVFDATRGEPATK